MQRAPTGASIFQVCVCDHSTQPEPHLHVRVILEVQGREHHIASNWRVLTNVTLEELKAGLQRVTGSTTVRIHMHERMDDLVHKVADELLERLWSCSTVLTDADCAALEARSDCGCPICLEPLQAGDEILCLPCDDDAEHHGHWQCLKPWLEKANTCPCCRSEFPSESGDRDLFDRLIDQSLASVAKLKREAEDAVVGVSASSLQKDEAPHARRSPSSQSKNFADVDGGDSATTARLAASAPVCDLGSGNAVATTDNATRTVDGPTPAPGSSPSTQRPMASGATPVTRPASAATSTFNPLRALRAGIARVARPRPRASRVSVDTVRYTR